MALPEPTIASGSSKSGTSNKGCGLVFAVVWIAFSSLFLIFGVVTLFSSVTPSVWSEVPCRVERFEIVATPDQDCFSAEVLFRYEWEGQQYTSTRFSAEDKCEQDYEKLARWQAHYQKSAAPTCHVLLTQPEEAALQVGSRLSKLLAGLALSGFGTVFVTIGIFVFRAVKQQKVTLPADEFGTKKALSSVNDSDKGSWFLIAFLSVFGAVGLALFIFFSIPTWGKFIKAQSWVEIPAEVIWSKVRSSDTDDGTSYRADVFYRYHFNGNEHHSNTRTFLTGSSTGYSGSKEFVDAYPAGSSILCYVNPDQPWQAVLERKPGWWLLLTLFPLPFMAVGVGAYVVFRKHRRKKAAQAHGRTDHHSLRAAEVDTEFSLHHESSAKTFAPHGTRISTFLVTLLITLFWNGIISIFVVQAVRSWLASDPEWVLTIFLIPFVLIGLFLLVASLFSFLGLFTAKPVLTVAPGKFVLGDTVNLSWRLSAGLIGLKDLNIYLVGEEEAQYMRGTTTTTDRQVFHEQRLVEATSTMEINLGSCSFSLPADTSPSWQSEHNAVKWTLKVRGKGSFYAHISDDYEVTLHARHSS